MPLPVILQTNILNSWKGGRNILINKVVFRRAANIVKPGCRPGHRKSCREGGRALGKGKGRGTGGGVGGGIAVLVSSLAYNTYIWVNFPRTDKMVKMWHFFGALL